MKNILLFSLFLLSFSASVLAQDQWHSRIAECNDEKSHLKICVMERLQQPGLYEVWYGPKLAQCGNWQDYPGTFGRTFYGEEVLSNNQKLMDMREGAKIFGDFTRVTLDKKNKTILLKGKYSGPGMWGNTPTNGDETYGKFKIRFSNCIVD